jgi:hypothetical protein
MRWSNTGIGRLYRKHAVMLCLLDDDGKTACSQEQPHLDPTTWLPGDYQVRAEMTIPSNLRPGEYTMAVALVDPVTRLPAIRLANDVREEARIHFLSRVRIE